MEKEKIQKRLPVYNQLRSLKQYKDMSDEEFDLLFADKLVDTIVDQNYETQIENKLEEFKQEYDIDDLKINDRLLLRALMQSIITVEELNKTSYNLRGVGISQNNIVVAEKINRMITEQLNMISKMQDDLKITRRIRKGDSEISAANYIESLKIKAKEFYDQRMQVVTCPKCKHWIFSGWYLYPYESNKVTLVCNTTMEDGTKCGEVIKLNSSDLFNSKNRGYSDPTLFPESLV